MKFIVRHFVSQSDLKKSYVNGDPAFSACGRWINDHGKITDDPQDVNCSHCGKHIMSGVMIFHD